MFSCHQSVTLYWPEGGISSEGYLNKDSLEVGKWIHYYDYPLVYAIVRRDNNGLKHGKREKYYKNGELISIEKFSHGVQNGTQKYFYTTGEDSLVFEMKNDSLIEGTYRLFSKKGELIDE